MANHPKITIDEEAIRHVKRLQDDYEKRDGRACIPIFMWVDSGLNPGVASQIGIGFVPASEVVSDEIADIGGLEVSFSMEPEVLEAFDGAHIVLVGNRLVPEKY